MTAPFPYHFDYLITFFYAVQSFQAIAFSHPSVTFSEFKGLVHPKMKVLSSVTHSHVMANIKDFHPYSEHE